MITEKQLASPPGATARQKPVWRRQFAVWSRWLHIYLSMVSFAIVFFFAATGLTLNHVDWFGGQQRTIQVKGSIEASWLKGDVQKLEVVERLRSAHGIRAAMSDFRVEESQCSVSFKGPGYTADAFIDRGTGTYDLTETRNGFFAVMNDLHKGRDSGRVWSWVIDVSAALLVLVSLSGFLLIFFLAKKRTSGLLVALVGTLLCWVLYLWFVP